MQIFPPVSISTERLETEIVCWIRIFIDRINLKDKDCISITREYLTCNGDGIVLKKYNDDIRSNVRCVNHSMQQHT